MLVLAIVVLLSHQLKAQLLTWSPAFPKETDANVTITVDANFGNKGLQGFAGDVYIHIGCITNLSTSPTNWKYVQSNWAPTNSDSYKATSLGSNRWQFTIPGANLRTFYSPTEAGEVIQRISLLFRSGDGSRVQRNADGSDMYIPVYTTSLAVRIDNPFRSPLYNLGTEPIVRSVGQTISITGNASQSATMRIFYNENQIASQSGVTTISASPSIATAGNQRIIVEAESGGIVRDTVDFFVAASTAVEPLPAGIKDGLNYSPDGTSVTLVQYAPNKSTFVVIGDFNDWTPNLNYQMKRTPDGLRYWLTINGLTPGQEYAYQYLVDGLLKVADYNCEKILDPWNDQYINNDPANPGYIRYPNLKPYPTGKTSDIVSVLEPGKPQYSWSLSSQSYQRPDKRNIITYEMHLRDFLNRSDFKTLIDTLNYISAQGVNAIELLPWTEFEGNNSWGYNPSFMFAVDKFYGPENDLKRFIDECHSRGIAVIMDMVLNHQFGQSPMVRLYWDAVNNRPAANSPWFNPVEKHAFNVGYDMNHESQATKDFVDRVVEHWLVSYKVDGFRWDLSKGFTQKNTCFFDQQGVLKCDVGEMGKKDDSRIAILNRIYDKTQQISPGSYNILEHYADNAEEIVLAESGFLLWGNGNNPFAESSMGYHYDLENGQPKYGKSNFGYVFHTTRGWGGKDGGPNVPHLIGFAESHDEERVLNKNVLYGNTANGTHNAKNAATYTKRMQAVNAFLMTIPGPKMYWQFGEIGYDTSITWCSPGVYKFDCRIDPKPLLWNYYTGPSAGPGSAVFNARRALRTNLARVLRLRTQAPSYLPTFTTDELSYDLQFEFKSQVIQSNALRMVVIGNFDVFQRTGSVTFPTTGNWIVYAHNVANFTGINGNLTANSINVNTPTQSFNMQPGEYILFLDRDPAGALPLKLLNFTGSRQTASIALNWQTESEQMVKEFELERSLDGVNFRTIATEKANNTGIGSRNQYGYKDVATEALGAPERVYYRVKMVDQDGKFTYSNIVAIAPLKGRQSLTVLPNPVKAAGVAEFEITTAGKVQLRILNQTGQVLGTIYNGYKDKGAHRVNLQSALFDVSRLPVGAYYLQMETAFGRQTVSLLKTN
jgi:hypothetical protein